MRTITFMNGRPYEMQIKNELEDMQKFVGGYIECVGLSNGIVIICNEEGRLKNLPYNVTIEGYDFVGRVILCDCNEDGEFTDISTEHIKWVYSQYGGDNNVA